MTDPQRETLSVADVIATYRRMRAIETALAARGTTLFMVTLLARFAEQPDARIGSVATELGFSAAVATTGLDRLEQRGLARRIEKSISDRSRDRRTVTVEVTDMGRAVLMSLAEIEVEL